jgi:hypothetical protein
VVQDTGIFYYYYHLPAVVVVDPSLTDEFVGQTAVADLFSFHLLLSFSIRQVVIVAIRSIS